MFVNKQQDATRYFMRPKSSLEDKQCWDSAITELSKPKYPRGVFVDRSIIRKEVWEAKDQRFNARVQVEKSKLAEWTSVIVTEHEGQTVTKADIRAAQPSVKLNWSQPMLIVRKSADKRGTLSLMLLKDEMDTSA